jgi:hypothetical protein
MFGRKNNLYYALSRENLERIIPNILLNNRKRVLNIQRIQASICLWLDKISAKMVYIERKEGNYHYKLDIKFWYYWTFIILAILKQLKQKIS